MIDQEKLEKLAKKRQYKLRGVLRSFETQQNGIGKILVSKGQRSDRKYFQFTSFGQNTKALSLLKIGFRIKIWFTIRCNEHNEKWYTNLILESFEHWEVNEDKRKKELRIEEIEKSQVKMDSGFKSKQFE